MSTSRRFRQSNRRISAERHRCSPLPNQPALGSTLHTLLKSDDDAPLVVAILFPLLDPDERDTALLAGSHVDFPVREVAARFVEANPAEHFCRVAQALSEDSYPQVGGPARRALQIIADPTVNGIGLPDQSPRAER